jgi:hypothetical protein
VTTEHCASSALYAITLLRLESVTARGMMPDQAASSMVMARSTTPKGKIGEYGMGMRTACSNLGAQFEIIACTSDGELGQGAQQAGDRCRVAVVVAVREGVRPLAGLGDRLIAGLGESKTRPLQAPSIFRTACSQGHQPSPEPRRRGSPWCWAGLL